jgi:CRP/FNR family transcriptional regulator, cyclic AMP receptor protein
MLQYVPLFAGLERNELEQIVELMYERHFFAGDTIIQQGADDAGLFLIAYGEADVRVGDQLVNTLGSGDYFGEIALLTGSERTATIVAKMDMLCYTMRPQDFRRVVDSNATIAWKVLTAMADKLVGPLAEAH